MNYWVVDSSNGHILRGFSWANDAVDYARKNEPSKFAWEVKTKATINKK